METISSEAVRKRKPRKGGFLRNPEMPLAQLANAICNKRGVEYLTSKEKAIIDKLLASPLLLGLIPGYVLAALIKLQDVSAPAFYIHDRVGRDGKLIAITKLRTLRVGADKEEAKSAKQLNGGRPQDDPRAFPLGSFVRGKELDEFFQIFNILKGEMAFIGPRMVTPTTIARVFKGLVDKHVRYALQNGGTVEQGVHEGRNAFKRWHARYITVHPGLAGLNSALSRDRKHEIKRVRLDDFYYENASLGLDLLIILWTIQRMKGHKAASLRKETNVLPPFPHQEVSVESAA